MGSSRGWEMTVRRHLRRLHLEAEGRRRRERERGRRAGEPVLIMASLQALVLSPGNLNAFMLISLTSTLVAS